MSELRNELLIQKLFAAVLEEAAAELGFADEARRVCSPRYAEHLYAAKALELLAQKLKAIRGMI